MKGVVDGLIEVTDEVKQSIELCLGCRACEPACPSGVNFGRLLEQAREAIHQTERKPLHERLVRNIAFDKLFPHHERMISTVGLRSEERRVGKECRSWWGRDCYRRKQKND